MSKYKFESFTILHNDLIYTIYSQPRECCCFFQGVDFYIKIQECDETTFNLDVLLKKKITEQEFCTISIYMRTNSDEKAVRYIEKYVITSMPLLRHFKIKPEKDIEMETSI